MFFVFVVCPGFPVGVLAVVGFSLARQENTLELATLLALCRSLVLCYVMFMIMWLNMLE